MQEESAASVNCQLPNGNVFFFVGNFFTKISRRFICVENFHKTIRSRRRCCFSLGHQEASDCLFLQVSCVNSIWTNVIRSLVLTEALASIFPGDSRAIAERDSQEIHAIDSVSAIGSSLSLYFNYSTVTLLYMLPI